MACTQPIRAWIFGQTENGKQKLVLKEPTESWRYEKQLLPCGKCISCRLSKASEWATRCFHESLLHQNNSFVTLTYAPEHLPAGGSLNANDLRNFIRRVRYFNNGINFHYLACGEYGHNPTDGKVERPHYHICLFGIHFKDQKYFFSNKRGDPIYRSEILERLWTKGHSTCAEFTYDTAAYTARYTLKKIQETTDNEKRITVDTATGEIQDWQEYERLISRNGKIRPFIRCSQGIGKAYYDKFKTDMDKDYLIAKGKKHKIPRYYDKLLAREDEGKMEVKKQKRKQEALKRKSDNTKVRRQAKAKIINQSISRLNRSYDNDS